MSYISEQESGLKVNHPASFAVSLNGAKGQIDAKVHSPSGDLECSCVTYLDQVNYYHTILQNNILHCVTELDQGNYYHTILHYTILHCVTELDQGNYYHTIVQYTTQYFTILHCY